MQAPGDVQQNDFRKMLDEAMLEMDSRIDEIYREEARNGFRRYGCCERRGPVGREPAGLYAMVFSKARDRLRGGAVAEEFFTQIVERARRRRLLWSEHFTVDGTLIEA